MICASRFVCLYRLLISKLLEGGIADLTLLILGHPELCLDKEMGFSWEGQADIHQNGQKGKQNSSSTSNRA